MQAGPPPEPPSAAIVVTAKALPDPATDQAYGVDRIDAKSLQNAPSTQLEQVLKDVPPDQFQLWLRGIELA